MFLAQTLAGRKDRQTRKVSFLSINKRQRYKNLRKKREREARYDHFIRFGSVSGPKKLRCKNRTHRLNAADTTSVVDPDPYSGASWIRIRIRNTDPDPHMQI